MTNKVTDKTAAEKQPDPKALESVKLLKDHTHARELHAKGTSLKVDAATADWLRAHGVVAKEAEGA